MSYQKLRQTVAEMLATAYQMPDDEIANILPDNEEDFNESDAKTKLLEADKNRITTINQKGKDRFDQGYSKAKKEERAAFEKEIREEYNIDDEDVFGVDLIRKVVESNTGTKKVDVSKLSNDEIVKHPEVIRLLNEKEKTFKEKEKELKEGFDSQLAKFNRDKTFSVVSNKALLAFESLNPVLSPDPKKAAKQKEIILRELDNYDYQIEGDTITPLNKDGKRLENAHGHGIGFEELVKSVSEPYFDFQQSEKRDAPPAGQGSGDGGGIKIPKTEAEYAEMISDTSIPLEERQKIRESYQKQTANS